MKKEKTKKVRRPSEMLNYLKELFVTKRGVLVVLAMMTLAICAYLNLITLKGVDLFSIGKLGDTTLYFRVSLGTLMVSFIPMITSEIMSEVYGWKKAFIISSVAYTVCLLFTIILDLTVRIPFNTDIYNQFNGHLTSEAYAQGNATFIEHYDNLFGGCYTIIIASAIAYYVGIFFNCYIMGKMQKKAIESGKDNSAKRFGRFVLSTVVGQTLDNAIFFLIPQLVIMVAAAANHIPLTDIGALIGMLTAPHGLGGALIPWIENGPWTYFWQQTLAAFVIEIAFEAIFFPLTNFLTKRVEKLPETLEPVEVVE